jgi:hypothetical protein
MAQSIDAEALAIAAQKLEKEIVAVSEGMRALQSTRLKQETLVVLLQDITKLNKGQITYVLNALARLEDLTLKKPKS